MYLQVDDWIIKYRSDIDKFTLTNFNTTDYIADDIKYPLKKKHTLHILSELANLYLPKNSFTNWQQENIEKYLEPNKAIIVNTNDIPLICLGSLHFKVRENDDTITFEKVKRRK